MGIILTSRVRGTWCEVKQKMDATIYFMFEVRVGQTE